MFRLSFLFLSAPSAVFLLRHVHELEEGAHSHARLVREVVLGQVFQRFRRVLQLLVRVVLVCHLDHRRNETAVVQLARLRLSGFLLGAANEVALVVGLGYLLGFLQRALEYSHQDLRIYILGDFVVLQELEPTLASQARSALTNLNGVQVLDEKTFFELLINERTYWTAFAPLEEQRPLLLLVLQVLRMLLLVLFLGIFSHPGLLPIIASFFPLLIPNLALVLLLFDADFGTRLLLEVVHVVLDFLLPVFVGFFFLSLLFQLLFVFGFQLFVAFFTQFFLELFVLLTVEVLPMLLSLGQALRSFPLLEEFFLLGGEVLIMLGKEVIDALLVPLALLRA